MLSEARDCYLDAESVHESLSVLLHLDLQVLRDGGLRQRPRERREVLGQVGQHGQPGKEDFKLES